jgi:uncharacterized protein YfaS (alpha-2-macroglobulin family)
MLPRSAWGRWTAIVLLTGTAGLFWRAVAAEKPPEAAAQPEARPGVTNTETLGGADRYQTYVSTDKPIYRPGEKVYARGVLLHHETRRPFPADTRVDSIVEIIGPKGDTIASGNVAATDSVLGFSWEIPPSQAGGEYTVKFAHPWLGYAPAERKFDIRAYRAPRLRSQIKFLRDGYGPADEVVATLDVKRAEGGVPAGARVTAIARVDGLEAYRGGAVVDDKGACTVRFQLPVDIRRGEGTLALVVEDGGVVETASKTIPILLQTVDLTLYPEGGDLVAGLSSRVYFEAVTPAKKPADLAGVVVDGDGRKVAEFRSEHEGRGRFSFVPEAGKAYTLRITEPSGIKTLYALPEVKSEGVVLASAENTTAGTAQVKVAIAAAKAGKYTVTLHKRERQIAAEDFPIEAGQSREISLPAGDAGGVLIVTVWDSANRPLAERLVYRQPAEVVNVKITADASRYVPGGKARLDIETTDGSGKPVTAVVGVTVTDDSVLEMIEKREQAPRLPVMVLLEGEVRELADAHVYLDPENEKAPLAVDLLLGTQGWRRFALVRTADFLTEHGDSARRVLALRLATRREIERSAVKSVFPGRADLARPRGEAGLVPPAAQAAEAPGAAPENAAPPPAAAPAVPEPAGPPARDPVPAEQPNAAELRPLAHGAPPPPPESKDRKALDDALEAGARRAQERQLVAGKLQARNDFISVRVYAHEVRAGRKPGDRADFTETLFWHAGARTDDQGRASVAFGLSDSVTSFRVFADAFTSGGAVGSGAAEIESVEPFYLEPKLPLEVTMGDRIRVPIGIVNAGDAPLDDAGIRVDAHVSQDVRTTFSRFSIPAGARLRRIMEVNVGKFNGQAQFVLSANAGGYSDKVTRTLMVRPLGFPAEFGKGGMLGPGETVTHEIEIPADVVPGSMEARVVVYPTPLASMTEALQRLIREPYGCFEQTSSTTYPLVMAQQYFLSHQGVDPAHVEKSSLLLTTGYERLVGFECKSGGYEWFGADPGHDALTAYGLMEFTDMAQVRHVDPAMLERTRNWLLAQRDGKGTFARKTHTLHTWLADPEIATAYNTWALLEAGVDADLSREVAYVRDAAEKSPNTYVMALGANVLALAKDVEGSNRLLDKLAGKQSQDGSLAGATTSVVGSGGEALTIETTALAMTAWLKNPSFVDNVERSAKYLAESCKAGRFGSTQSTVLALRAIVAYDKSRATPKAPGSLQLLVDGRPVGEPVKFGVDSQGAIELPALANLLTPGKHTVQVAMEGGSQMPFSAAVRYHALKPRSSDECRLHLEVKLRNESIDEGAITEAQVVVVNRANEPIPTPMAIVGIPGGLEARHDQLKELVKAGRIDAYEVLGRDVVLYWRGLKAEERVELPISLVAAIPGSYTGPASRAYLYYTDEHKHWVDGLKVEISPKSE